MQNNQSQQSNNEEQGYELKRQEGLREQEKRQKQRILKKMLRTALILLALGGVITLIGWQGVRLNKQQASIVASSNQGGFAPDFELPATIGGKIQLSDYRSKKNMLLYFHEGLSCQPCWEQIPELERALPEFERMSVALLSIALDPVDQWKDTIEQYKIKTPTLSYQDSNTEQVYNLLPYSMGMGRRAGHTFVLVDKDGVIKWRRDYWPSRGHMVAGGTMFVEAKYIVEAVEKALNQ